MAVESSDLRYVPFWYALTIYFLICINHLFFDYKRMRDTMLRFLNLIQHLDQPRPFDHTSMSCIFFWITWYCIPYPTNHLFRQDTVLPHKHVSPHSHTTRLDHVHSTTSTRPHWFDHIHLTTISTRRHLSSQPCPQRTVYSFFRPCLSTRPRLQYHIFYSITSARPFDHVHLTTSSRPRLVVHV